MSTMSNGPQFNRYPDSAATGLDFDRASPTAGGGPRMIHFPPTKRLITFDGATAKTTSLDFRVETPDSRVRVSIALIGLATNPNDQTGFLFNKNVKLWLRAVEDDEQTDREVDTVNLAGTTKAAPLKIPFDTRTLAADSGLGGWGREFVTAGTAIVGTLTVVGVADAIPGQLRLQARYYPEGTAHLPWQEWEEIRSGLTIGRAQHVTVG